MSVVGRYARHGSFRTLLEMRHTGVGTIVSNVSTLSATAAVTSGLGFVFWSLAARTAPPAAVGLAAAAISASTLLATISMLGLGTLLIGEVAGGRDRDPSVLTTSVVVVGTTSTLLGLGFAILGPNFIKDLGPLSLGLPFVALFVITCATTAVGLLTDQLMVGLLRAELQLARNSLFSLAKLGALALASPLLVNDKGLLVFGVWPLGNLISMVALGAYVARRPIGIGLAPPKLQLVRRMGRAALSHHALNLSAQATGQILPVLVTVMLSTTANAYFYTSWMIATVAFIPQNALSVTLYALGAREPAALRSRARLTVLLGFVEGLAAIGLVELLAPWILTAFGKTYAVEASLSLRIMVLAVIPSVIKAHFIALSRITGRVRAGGVTMALSACVELGAAAAGGYLGGLPGLSVGWVLGICLEAIWMFPTIWRVIGPTRTVASASLVTQAGLHR